MLLTCCQYCICIVLIFKWISLNVNAQVVHGVNKTFELYLRYLIGSTCELKLNCLGQDCIKIPDKSGCFVCACPLGSAARGCDPIPHTLAIDLFVNGCPRIEFGGILRHPAQKVQRWYRKVIPEKDIDECHSYSFPFCQALDFNLWRSPETFSDCRRLCYGESGAKEKHPFHFEPEITSSPFEQD